jgi:hypothetical protein
VCAQVFAVPQRIRNPVMKHTLTAMTLAVLATTAAAQTVSPAQFVNGLALSGNTLDTTAGSDAERRVGFFSDIYYDTNRNEWWGLSDRGPGGGLLPYETRVQRFSLDINASTGSISNFQVQQTLRFGHNGAAFNGIAPNPGSTLGQAFDPEGLVINPVTGNLLVSDEYGPSVYEFNRSGELVRQYTTPANLIPRAADGTPNFASDTGNTLGKRNNRGFEGLAISPDGRYAYAVLQSPTLEEGGAGGNGRFARIVKFDTATGTAVGQYAYQMDRSGQGQGISALVALGNDRFMVLERNNRGVGVGATLATADKAVYQIDLSSATDVSAIALPASGTTLPAGVAAVAKGAKVIDLDANTLAALGGISPEKWESLAIGPQLADGRYLVLAGTDNDYSVTQSGTGTQYDVYFRFADADPYASSIQCPIGQVSGCFLTSNNSTSASLTGDHQLLPGVLHAYAANVVGYVTPVPEPAAPLMALAGLGLIAGWARKRSKAA